MDVHAKLDEITAMIEGARAMPMSASCIVNRVELRAMLDDLRALLPGELSRAAAILRERDAVIEQARAEGLRVLEEAAAERARMVSASEVVREAAREAERLVAEAQEDAARTRADVDDYVDSKLANFEVVLQKTLKAVERGRSKLVGDEELVAAGLGDGGLADPSCADPGFDDLGAASEAFDGARLSS